MRRFLSISFSVVAALATFSMTSCEGDKCKAIVCANNGACNEDNGDCTCPLGYIGERCETIARKSFIGTWTVDEDGTVSNVARYSVSVENGPEIHQVNIRNFANLNTGTIIGNIQNDTIIIPVQSFEVGTLTKTVEGYGIVDPKTFYGDQGEITFYYKITSSDGTTDAFGYRGSGFPSRWTK
jgi:hypothetical protein